MKTKYKFLIPLSWQEKNFITLFTLEDLGESIEKKLDSFCYKKLDQKLIPFNSFLIMKEEISSFYSITKRFTSFMLKEIQDYYDGIGNLIGLSKADFETLDEHYSVLGKDSKIKSWDALYEVVNAIVLLNKELIKEGIIYQKEIIKE